MRSFLFALAVATSVLAVPAAADRLWKWDYSASGISAKGTFTTVQNPDSNGGYLIIAITGERNGKAITGLQAPGTWIPGNEPYKVDNLVFAGTGAQLTSHGFGFALSDGTYSNPFHAHFLPTPVYLEFFSTPPAGHTEVAVRFSATMIPVPEPATYGMLIAAFGLIAFEGLGACLSLKRAGDQDCPSRYVARVSSFWRVARFGQDPRRQRQS